MSGAAADPIVLRFPASVEHVRLARLLASAVAATESFTVDDLEDVRLVVDEVCTALVLASAPGATVEVRLHCDGHAVEMHAEVAVDGDDAPLTDELTGLILATAADEHQLTRDGTRAIARVFKRASAT